MAYERVTGGAIPVELRKRLVGASPDQAAERLGDYFRREFSAEAIEAELLKAAGGEPLAPMEGVKALLQFLHKARLPLAGPTNGPRPFVETVLGELVSFFEFVRPSAELTPARHKPETDVYLPACARLGFVSSECVAFEDAEVGAESAGAGGLSLVFVNADDNPPESFGGHYVPTLGDDPVYQFLRSGGAA